MFLEKDKTTVCDRVTVTTADGIPGVVSTVAYRTRVQGSEAEFETAWESFGAPEDVAVDPKPLVVVHASVRRWPARPPDHWRCACATWNPEGATRCEAERCTRLRARDDELATRGDPA